MEVKLSLLCDNYLLGGWMLQTNFTLSEAFLYLREWQKRRCKIIRDSIVGSICRYRVSFN